MSSIQKGCVNCYMVNRFKITKGGNVSFMCKKCSTINHMCTCPICFNEWPKIDNEYYRPEECKMHEKMHEMSNNLDNLRKSITYTNDRIESIESKMNTLIEYIHKMALDINNIMLYHPVIGSETAITSASFYGKVKENKIE